MSEYCPRGVGFPELLHLTVPYHMNFFQANGVFFSMLPVALMILFFFIFVFTRKFQFIILFSLGCLASGVNQFVLKPMKEQARPPESCLKDTDGFPSGHSVNAMGVWAFITLQELTNYRASWPRKIILCLIYLLTFSFNGPARNVVKDHTWEQIAVGCAAGAIWGTVVWMFFRFIFQRWLLEKLMCTRFARWIRLLNDLDPEFRHSKYKGEKFRGKMNELSNLKHDTTETSALINREGDDQTPRKKRVIIVHIISVVIQLILGALAMPINFYKADMPPESVCPRADIGLVLSIGSFTLATGVALAIVALLVYRRWCGKTWFPLVLKGSLIFAGTMLMQGALYCYLTFDSVKKQRCPHDDRISRTTGYIIAWGTVEATMIIFWIGLFFIMRLPRLYGNPKLTYPVNGGIMPTAF